MGSKPGPKQRPETLQGVHVNLTKSIAVIVSGELTRRMADGSMGIAPSRQPAVDVILIGIHDAPWADRGPDDRIDGRLLDVLQHANPDPPGPLNHPQDRRLLLLQGPPAPLPLEASPPAESLLLPNRFGMPLMPSHDVHLVAFHLPGEHNRRPLLDDASPQLRAHPLGVVGIEVQLAGDRFIGEGQAQELEAEHTDPQGLMMAGEDGPGEVVEAAGTGLAKVALPCGLSLVAALEGDLGGVAVGAADPLRPPQVSEDLEAACIVDQGLNVEHSWSEPILGDSSERRSCEMASVFNCTANSRRVQPTPRNSGRATIIIPLRAVPSVPR